MAAGDAQGHRKDDARPRKEGERTRKENIMFIVLVEISYLQYRAGVPCPRRPGFVDLDLGCSAILLGQ